MGKKNHQTHLGKTEVPNDERIEAGQYSGRNGKDSVNTKPTGRQVILKGICLLSAESMFEYQSVQHSLSGEGKQGHKTSSLTLSFEIFLLPPTLTLKQNSFLILYFFLSPSSIVSTWNTCNPSTPSPQWPDSSLNGHSIPIMQHSGSCAGLPSPKWRGKWIH